MEFQVLSDLHLETKPGWVKPPRHAPVLFLAGDIGDPYSKKWREFITYCANTWDKVFYVAGNHEHYKNQMEHVNTHIQKEFCEIDPEKLVLLQRGKMRFYNGYLVVGCTLWSDIDDYAFSAMNDHIYIKKMKQPFTIQDYREEYAKDSSWLAEVIRENSIEKMIVMTHHVPTYKVMDPCFERYGTLNSGFYSSLDNLIAPHVKLWISGHTHKAADTIIGETRMIINPIGYAHEATTYRDKAFVLG